MLSEKSRSEVIHRWFAQGDPTDCGQREEIDARELPKASQEHRVDTLEPRPSLVLLVSERHGLTNKALQSAQKGMRIGLLEGNGWGVRAGRGWGNWGQENDRSS